MAAASPSKATPPRRKFLFVDDDAAAISVAREVLAQRDLALGTDAAPQASIKALEAGFFLYLVKPLDAGQLSEALDYALEFSALERAEL